MNRFQRRDILGIDHVSRFTPYEDDDGWLIASPGCEDRRKRNGKFVVALSEVEIRLHTENDKSVCLRHLEESDRRFSTITSNPWDWQSVRTHGLRIKFAVEWYDLEFFMERRDAYQDADHNAMYSDFGATLEDLTIKHFLVDKAGNRTPA